MTSLKAAEGESSHTYEPSPLSCKLTCSPGPKLSPCELARSHLLHQAVTARVYLPNQLLSSTYYRAVIHALTTIDPTICLFNRPMMNGRFGAAIRRRDMLKRAPMMIFAGRIFCPCHMSSLTPYSSWRPSKGSASECGFVTFRSLLLREVSASKTGLMHGPRGLSHTRYRRSGSVVGYDSFFI